MPTDDDVINLLTEGLPNSEAAVIRDAVIQRLATPTPSGEIKHIDPALDSDHSFAFRWADMVALSDLLEAFGSAKEGGDLKIAALKKLVLSWRRLRSIRVELTREQTMVVLAVKRGQQSLAGIEMKTGLPAERLKTIVGELCGMMYLEKTPILRENKGIYSTEF